MTKIISWNVNGIRAAIKKGFIEFIHKYDPDLVCIQETKAKVDQLSTSLTEDHGYHTYWHSADKAGYSGVATFCKEEPYFVQEGLGIDRFDSEGRVLITEHENFLLYNIYFPNGQKDDIRLNYKLDFLIVSKDEINVEQANDLIDSETVKYILLTSSSLPARLISSEGNVEIVPPDFKTINSTGAGDATAAYIASFGIDDLIPTIKNACAAGAIVAGTNEKPTLEKIQEISALVDVNLR